MKAMIIISILVQFTIGCAMMHSVVHGDNNGHEDHDEHHESHIESPESK